MIKTYLPTGGKMKAEPVKKGFLPKKRGGKYRLTDKNALPLQRKKDA